MVKHALRLLNNNRALAIFLIVIGLAPLAWNSPYFLTLMTFIGFYALLAMGLSILFGYTGQLSLAHPVFYGMGAYLSGYLTTHLGVAPLPALVLAAIITSVITLLVAIPVFWLRGYFVAVATFALLVIFQIFLSQAEQITGGHSGMRNIPHFSVGTMVLDKDIQYYYLVWFVVMVFILASQNILNSRAGRALRAVQSAETAAAGLGVNTAMYKLEILVFTAIFASIAGSLYAYFVNFISPSSFGVDLLIALLVMVYVGGTVGVWAPLIGAATITVLQEGLKSTLPRVLPRMSGEAIMIFFGLIIIAILLFMPQGLVRTIAQKLSVGRRGLPKQPSSVGNESLRPQADFVRPESKTERPALQLVSVSKSFGALRAVATLDMKVETDRITGLIGPNGAGKTTTVNLISGSVQPDEGRILLDGKRIDGLRSDQIALLGAVRTFQNVQLFGNMSVLENVMVGLHSRTRASMAELAFRLPSTSKEEKWMRGSSMAYLEMVGLADKWADNALSLPLGQQRCVEMARALAAQPSVLMLDEPGAGLSSKEKSDMAALLLKIRRPGLALILVEHDMELVMRLCDWVVVLNYGEKICEGSPDTVRQDEKVITAYLGVEE